ncbi:unnamed protein product [Acanthocheilonema viteae]|uniref:Uncharacterized protein n=1 Tax=Acanthocheilonema viteae TaxID=6277 RepID=A0A498S5B0_ACAVI|nr:unnamed protein product [Acanthocheilonema viteae]
MQYNETLGPELTSGPLHFSISQLSGFLFFAYTKRKGEVAKSNFGPRTIFRELLQRFILTSSLRFSEINYPNSFIIFTMRGSIVPPTKYLSDPINYISWHSQHIKFNSVRKEHSRQDPNNEFKPNPIIKEPHRETRRPSRRSQRNGSESLDQMLTREEIRQQHEARKRTIEEKIMHFKLHVSTFENANIKWKQCIQQHKCEKTNTLKWSTTKEVNPNGTSFNSELAQLPLPTFFGNPKLWRGFQSSFDAAVHLQNIPDI